MMTAIGFRSRRAGAHYDGGRFQLKKHRPASGMLRQGRGVAIQFVQCARVLGAAGFAGVDQVAEFLGGLEVGDALGGDVDALAGFGVAANAGIALANAE